MELDSTLLGTMETDDDNNNNKTDDNDDDENGFTMGVKEELAGTITRREK